MTAKCILFDTGFITRTPAALVALMGAQVTEYSLIERHQSGDFGDLSPEDWSANERAVAEGGRVFSSYRVAPDTKVWVITEADRSSTTLLLPSDY